MATSPTSPPSPTPSSRFTPGQLTPRQLTGLLLAAAQTPLGSTMIAIAVPLLATEMRTDAAILTHLLVSGYLVVGILLQSPGGRLGDMFGHARLILVGEGLFALGAICGTLAVNAAMLTAARVLMAAGGALVVPAAIATMRLYVSAERLGRAYGRIGAVLGFAAACGPPLGGVLLAEFGWRSLFFINVPLLGLAVVLQLGLARAGKGPASPAAAAAARHRFDWVGTLLQGGAIIALAVGAMGHSVGAAVVGVGIAIGLGLLTLFVAYELRAPAPVVDPRLFARRSYTAGSLAVGLQSVAMYGLLFQLPHLYGQLRAVTAADLGAVMFGMMGCMVVGAPLGGRMVERIGPRWTALAGGLLATTGVALLVDVTALRVPSDALAGLALLGFGIGLTNAPAQVAAMSAVPLPQAGMAAGVMSTVRYLGGVGGMAVFGALLAGDAIRDAASHATLLLIYVAALAAATVMTLLLPARSPRAEPTAAP